MGAAEQPGAEAAFWFKIWQPRAHLGWSERLMGR
jgi:hypothetical protein